MVKASSTGTKHGPPSCAGVGPTTPAARSLLALGVRRRYIGGPSHPSSRSARRTYRGRSGASVAPIERRSPTVADYSSAGRTRGQRTTA
ncbi:MAG: hypothetical protein QOI68_5851 [Pseudonocardiales bacterium]|nr:hypothetical protein [Pseudonocardiales bacterium]